MIIDNVKKYYQLTILTTEIKVMFKLIIYSF